jgi:hypothetical protein
MIGRFLFVVLICLLLTSFQYSAISASTNQERASVFIEEVLPIDIDQWHIELKATGNNSDIIIQDRLEMYNISTRDDDKVLIYFLSSMVGTADSVEVVFIVRENHFIQSIIDIDNAPSYSTFGPLLEVDNVVNFLVNYQSWSELESTEMIEMLSNVDLSQNISICSGHLTMSITKIDSATKLTWMFLNLGEFVTSFKNNFPIGFYDSRQIDSNTPSPNSTVPTERNAPHLEPVDYIIPISVIFAIVIFTSVLLYGQRRKNLLN